MPRAPTGRRTVATNRKARHRYQLLDQWEAGLVLVGPEVKSVRAGKVSFKDSFAKIEGGEVWLHNLHITPYDSANRWNADPERPRKLLLQRREIRKLVAAVEQKGLTLVPLNLYLKGPYVKATLALAKGKQLHDKREALRRRTQEREARRAMQGEDR
ncbi:MAG: SsrA-binding protein SmpB [Gammaproteobacteria bacterium]|nr:SsrA-binding protein SmpB [Gammaproteobacteria bacterium]MDE0248634.1 SsrA-binding protein SmpB [Gammaproteobacteria bacterium]